MLVTYRGGMGEGVQKIHTSIYKIITKDAMYVRVTTVNNTACIFESEGHRS